jgi:hypothetical protein
MTTARWCMHCHVTSSEPAQLTLHLGRGEIKVTLEGVPGHRCTNCGGESLDGPFAEELSEDVDRVLRAIEAARAVPAEA